MDQNEVYYQAMLARDSRFDGTFYVGVRTTRIYCRPICPAKPKRENVVFFRSAAQAESAGYRPCLRCRPECAPNSPGWLGTSATVKRALTLIAHRRLAELSEARFAEQLGVTGRHLRRLFVNELGMTPKQVSDTNRLNFARQLVVETNLPVTTIAVTAGFGSVRRFNDAFQRRFHRSPTELRRNRRLADDALGVELSLAYRPPLDWDALLNFFRTHAIPGVEAVADQRYQRVFEIEGSIGTLEVELVPDEAKLRLRVNVDDPRHLFIVAQKVRRMFDLDSDPEYVRNVFSRLNLFRTLWDKYPGLRITGAWDPFECAVCTILGQVVSLAQARTLVSQLVRHYGTPIDSGSFQEPEYLFPGPEKLAQASLEEVKTTAKRRETIRTLAQHILDGKLSFTLPVDPIETRRQLLQIPGVGNWSAQYISLRALGDLDAFPKDDLILKRALQMTGTVDLELLRPWRAYAAIYLWREFYKGV